MTVVHALTPVYYFGSIFPLLAVIVCWIVFYGKKHHTPGLILTISETVCPFPESRIFAIAMNIEVWAIVVMYVVRNTLFEVYAGNSNKEYGCRHGLIKWTMRICTVFVPLGLAVLSGVTLDESKPVHLVGAFAFFIGGILYNIVSDLGFRWAKAPFSIVSWLFTWICLGCAALYAILLGGFPDNKRLQNAGAVFQYLTCLCMFIKFFLYQFDIPRHHLNVAMHLY